MDQWHFIDQDISTALGTNFKTTSSRSVGGGCINDAFSISDGVLEFFVKLNSPENENMFAAEAAGLNEIRESKSVYAPKPLCWGSSGVRSYIVMESLALGGKSTNAGVTLGQQLARMHKKSAQVYGWKMDNTIGSTRQPNTTSDNWLDFLGQRRLGFQIDLAEQNGCRHSLRSKGEKLIENLRSFFSGYSPLPSLLHGDLWSGNYAVTVAGHPVIFDPAVYFGDREADIAMTELFGGFSRGFYDAYSHDWPLDSGYSVRKTLYNLYHILNHFNLFGGGYESQAEQMIDKLLSEI